MQKLTITVSDEVYEGLYAKIGRGRISKFIDNLARPHVVEDSLAEGYAAMAADEAREAEAMAWSEGLVGDLDFPDDAYTGTAQHMGQDQGESRDAPGADDAVGKTGSAKKKSKPKKKIKQKKKG